MDSNSLLKDLSERIYRLEASIHIARSEIEEISKQIERFIDASGEA